MQANSSTNQLGEGVSETDWGNRPQAQYTDTSLYPSVSSRNNSPHPPSSALATTTSRVPLSRQPSVRIRRLPSQQIQQQQHVQFASQARGDGGVADGRTRPEYASTGRRRSSSDPRPAPGHAAPAQSHGLTRSTTALSGLPTLNEEDSQGQGTLSTAARGPSTAPPQRPGIIQRASNATLSALGRRDTSRYDNGQLDSTTGSTTHQEYDEDLVNILDVVDPQVATLSTLTNVQNSLFVPNLGKYLDRRPTYTLLRDPTTPRGAQNQAQVPPSRQSDRPHSITDSQAGTTAHLQSVPEADFASGRPTAGLQRSQTADTITSVLNDKHYAVLPHGVSLQNWTAEEKAELDDHVRHMLHSRRSKMKRRWKAFEQYVRRPLGFLISLYAFLITLFGLAWVLFLIGWINVGDRHIYIVHVIDSVLVALFGVIGYGLAPFRAVDTYHMIYIAHYHRLTWRIRRERNMPDLHDKNDLPDNGVADEKVLARRNTATIVATTGMEVDLESGLQRLQPKRKSTNNAAVEQDANKKKKLRLPGWMIRIKNTFRKPVEEVEGIRRQNLPHQDSQGGQTSEKKQRLSSGEENDAASSKSTSSASSESDNEYSVLTPQQQAKLIHHSTIFARSHTFYKPHETFTHYAFPLWILILVVVLLDCHSLLQFSLGATTWGIYYKNRHEAITSTILCLSITVNITAGVMISVGDKKSRKKDIVDRLARQELTNEAIQHIERKRQKRNKEYQQAASRRFEEIEHEVEGSNSTSGNGTIAGNTGISRKGELKDTEKPKKIKKKSLERERARKNDV